MTDEVISIDFIDIPSNKRISSGIEESGWYLGTMIETKVLNFYIQDINSFGGSTLNSDFKRSVKFAIRNYKLESLTC